MNSTQYTKQPVSFWKIKIPLPYVLIIVIISGILNFWQHHRTVILATNSHIAAEQKTDCPPPQSVQYRMKGYQYARPLLLSDLINNENKNITDLNNDIKWLIEQKIQEKQITSASVYLRKLNDGKWISVNDGASYNPGSLIKVPIMMTYLRESELKPGLLDHQIFFKLNGNQPPNQTFAETEIEPGKSYKIRDLIYDMVVKSDNRATMLLNENVNTAMFKQLFVDVGLPEPNLHDKDFQITASGYSKFFRVLYNATYLSNENADYALSLLTQSTFKEGIVKELPPDIKVAHKFGEWGKDNDPLNHQLHESGIIYLDNSPYLITIMTKGENVQNLPQVISDISKRVFNKFTSQQLAKS